EPRRTAGPGYAAVLRGRPAIMVRAGRVPRGGPAPQDDGAGETTVRTTAEAGGALFHVDHLSRHAAVDDEICAGNETGALAIEQELHRLGDVLRLADAADRMLGVILPAQGAVVAGPDPAGAHAVDAYVGRKVHRQRVGERHEPALRGRIGLR